MLQDTCEQPVGADSVSTRWGLRLPDHLSLLSLLADPFVPSLSSKYTQKLFLSNSFLRLAVEERKMI